MAGSTSCTKSLRFMGDSVYIDSFLPPAGCNDAPTQDEDFPKLRTQTQATKAPPSPIRVVQCSEGIRLLDRDAYKLWLACRGGGPDGTGGLGMLHKNSVKVVKPNAGDHDKQEDVPGDKGQVADKAAGLASHSPVAEEPQAPGQRDAKSMKVSDLKPNKINAKIFVDSLSDEKKIQELAEDINHRSLQYPLLVKPDGTVLDGHRRLLALQYLGVKEAPVILVRGIETEEQERQVILRSYSSTRDATVREKVNVYRAYKAESELTQEHGKRQGRPEKQSQDEIVFWSPTRIGKEAAQKAGFRSKATAEKAVAIFKKATSVVQEKLVHGEMTISAAYKTFKTSRPNKNKGDGSSDNSASAGRSTIGQEHETTETDLDEGDSGEVAASTSGQASSDGSDGDDTRQEEGTVQEYVVESSEDPDALNRDKAEAAAEEQKTTCAAPLLPDLEDAWTVIQDFFAKSDTDEAVKRIQGLAKEAGVNTWIKPGDPTMCLCELEDLVREEVLHLAAENNEAAWDWLAGYGHGLQELHDELIAKGGE